MIRVSSAVQRHAQKLIVLFSLLFGASLLMSDNGFATDIKNTNASSPVNSESTKPTKAGEVKNVVRFAKTGSFDNDTVVRLARQLAKKPYVALKIRYQRVWPISVMMSTAIFVLNPTVQCGKQMAYHIKCNYSIAVSSSKI